MFSKVIYDMQNDTQERESKRARVNSSPPVVKIACLVYGGDLNILTYSNEKFYSFAHAKLIEMDAKIADAKAAMDADPESNRKKHIHRQLVNAVDTLKLAVKKANAADNVLTPTPEKGVECNSYERINPYKIRGWWSHAPIFDNNHFSFMVDIHYDSQLQMEREEAIPFIRPVTHRDRSTDNFTSEKEFKLLIERSISCEVEDVFAWHKK
jgi:hypothetical protein